jgi:hypothetical protein
MASEKNIIKLEKDIRGKMMQIKTGKIKPKDSGIGKSINLMKNIDEPLFDKLMGEYKAILSNIK